MAKLGARDRLQPSLLDRLIDALKQVVTQSWSYIGGFVAPTDTTTNPNTIPTASNAALKRAIILESL